MEAGRKKGLPDGGTSGSPLFALVRDRPVRALLIVQHSARGSQGKRGETIAANPNPNPGAPGAGGGSTVQSAECRVQNGRRTRRRRRLPPSHYGLWRTRWRAGGSGGRKWSKVQSLPAEASGEGGSEVGTEMPVAGNRKTEISIGFPEFHGQQIGILGGAVL